MNYNIRNSVYKKIIYSPMGDSITKGQGASSCENVFPVLLSKKIKDNYNVDIILNDGIREGGGGIKRSALCKIDNVISEKPNLVTIAFGTNDYNIKRKEYFLSPFKFYKCLNKVIDKLKENLGDDINIILVTTWNDGEKKYKWIFSYLYDFIIKKVGQQRNLYIADISKVWKGRSDTHTFKEFTDFQNINGDKFHPNDKGHNEISNIVFEQIQKII